MVTILATQADWDGLRFFGTGVSSVLLSFRGSPDNVLPLLYFVTAPARSTRSRRLRGCCVTESCRCNTSARRDQCLAETDL